MNGMITRLSYPPQMTGNDAEMMVRLLQAIPRNAGWSINRPVEPQGSSPVFNAFSAIVLLAEGGRGDALGDTPSEALLKAWALAHIDRGTMLQNCDHDWKESVHCSTGSAWDHEDRFLFCVKCRTAKDKDK